MSEAVTTDSATRETFQTRNPATGDVLATLPVESAAQIADKLADARAAQQWWAQIGFGQRKERLLKWRTAISGRIEEIAELIHREGGKPLDDARLEVILAVEHIDWAAKNARKVLGRRNVGPGLLLANYAASVSHVPYGVVGVIGPWNYPVFTPMGSIAYALAAGNTVLFKPSEYTPLVGKWLVESIADVVPEHPVLQLVTGLGQTGADLCTSGVDKIAFTGSTATGKKVMAACAQNLTPVLMECGGKDVLIIDEDADVPAAVDAAVFGGFSNAGQTCIGTERVYAHEKVYDDVVARLAETARSLVPGEDGGASYGPMTMPSQLDIVRRHVDDALDRGARAVVGGRDSVGERYVAPVVLADVPEDSLAVTEETFGPTVTVGKFATVDEAIAKANATRYGLGAAVFSKTRGELIAERLRTGMVSINSVVAFAGIASLPFGGVGDSGFGRIHGADGLREFARPQSVARLRVPLPLNVTSLARRPGMLKMLGKAVAKRFGA